LVHDVVTKKLKNICATEVTTNYLISMIGRQIFPNEHVNLSRFRGEQRTSQSETWLQLLNIERHIRCRMKKGMYKKMNAKMSLVHIACIFASIFTFML
jgi:hypothetical protein